MVVYSCPEGYYFNGSIDINVYAICHNWEWEVTFDSDAICVRKSHISDFTV